MAQQAEIKVTVAGETAEDLGVRFGEVMLEQHLSAHHRFSITCRALDKDAIGVYGSKKLDDLAKKLGEEVKIEVFIPSKASPRHTLAFRGLLLGATTRRIAAGGYELELHGASPTAIMDRVPRKRIWEEASLQDVFEQTVAEYGLASLSYKAGGGDVPPTLFQYGESDFSFMSRLAQRRLYWFFYDGDGLWCVDSLDSLDESVCQTVELTMESSSEENLLSRFELTSGTDQIRYRFRSFNPERAEHYTYATDQVQLSGKLHAWLEKARSASSTLFAAASHSGSEAAVLSAAELQSHVGSFFLSKLASLVVGSGETENPRVRPPAIVKISGVGADQEGEYLVTSAAHSMDVAQGHYHNWIQFIPLSAAFPQWDRPWPHAATLITGIVIDAYDDTKPGMVRVRLTEWVDGSTEKGSTTEGDVVTGWIRVLSPYAGKDHGIAFVPEIGDEVLVGFERGDPDRPVVVGSLYNQYSSAAYDRIKSDIPKNQGRVILTPAGHVIRLSDQAGKETIEVSTPDAKSSMTMVAGTSISISTTGDISISAGGKIDITAKKKITLDGTKGIEMKGHPEIKGSADDIILDGKTYKSTQSDKVEITCEGTIDATGQKGVTVEGTTELNLKASQGKVAASAMQSASVESQTADATVSGMTEAKITSGASMAKASPTGVDVMGPIVKVN